MYDTRRPLSKFINVGILNAYYAYMPSSKIIDVTLAVFGIRDLIEFLLLFCAQIIATLVIRSVLGITVFRGNSDTASHCSCCIPS